MYHFSNIKSLTEASCVLYLKDQIRPLTVGGSINYYTNILDQITVTSICFYLLH